MTPDNPFSPPKTDVADIAQPATSSDMPASGFEFWQR